MEAQIAPIPPAGPRPQHPGLGWMAMWLSRAQVEDLQTSLEFELVKIPPER
jgi:hypothetical protein